MKDSTFDTMEQLVKLEKSPKSRWRLFLINNAFVRNYRIFSQIGSPALVQMSTPLDSALPGLLIIKAVAMLDELIEEYIRSKSLSIPKKYRANLAGRTEYLAKTEVISNQDELDLVRRTRNKLAHDSSEQEEWTTYDTCIKHIHQALQDMELLDEDLASYTCSAERSALDMNTVEDGVLGRHTYMVSVQENGTRAAEIKWTKSIMDD